MNASYQLAQTMRLFGRQKRALFSMLFVVMIATAGAGVTLTGLYTSEMDRSKLTDKFMVNVFMEKQADSTDVLSTRAKLMAMPSVDSVDIVWQEEAFREFFSQHDLPSDELLDENPFPASITVWLDDSFHSEQAMQTAVISFRALPMVDDAWYRATFVKAAQEKLHRESVFAVLAGSVVLVIFLVILSAIIKSNTGLTRSEARTLSLNGASRLFIATPYFFFSSMCVFVGTLLGAGVLVGTAWYLQQEIVFVRDLPVEIVYVAGGVTWLVGSCIALFTTITTAGRVARA